MAVCAVEGNFDDAQTGVKRLFASGEVKERLAREGWQLSSANSINWGRLVPQIVYYFWAYSCLVKEGGAKPGEAVDFVVPTGNFGDILAATTPSAWACPLGGWFALPTTTRCFRTSLPPACTTAGGSSTKPNRPRWISSSPPTSNACCSKLPAAMPKWWLGGWPSPGERGRIRCGRRSACCPAGRF